MPDTTALQGACNALLDAARAVAGSNEPIEPADGGWNADQILAHVAIVNAATIAAAGCVAAGALARYDNRIAMDAWTIGHVIEIAGGNAGLRERIRRQADLLCALDEPLLSAVELDTLVPARLVSNGALLVDQPMPLRDLIDGLATAELPGHTRQLLDLLPASSDGRDRIDDAADRSEA